MTCDEQCSSHQTAGLVVFLLRVRAAVPRQPAVISPPPLMVLLPPLMLLILLGLETSTAGFGRGGSGGAKFLNGPVDATGKESSSEEEDGRAATSEENMRM